MMKEKPDTRLWFAIKLIISIILMLNALVALVGILLGGVLQLIFQVLWGFVGLWLLIKTLRKKGRVGLR